MKPLPLSVFIIAHNEADRIAATIDSVKAIAGEIVVIDSGSTDDTVAVAESHGARVIFNAWPGYGLQKRFGEDACTHHWLLNLDADEALTPELAAEIAALFAQGEPPLTGYVLQVRDMLPGEEVLLPQAHTNRCLRLYNRNKARFSESPVHDSVIVADGKTAELAAPVLHRSFRSLTHAIEKMNSYSSAQAENLQKKGLDFPLARLLSEFPVAFLKVYFIRGYALRGRRGFIYAVNYAFGRFMRIAKYLEKKEGL